MIFETKPLSEFAKFSQGIQVPIQHQSLEYSDDKVRFIRIVDITSAGKEPPRYIADPGVKYKVEESDLFMIRYGSPQVAKGWNGAIANNLFRINLINDEIDTHWLYYYLKQDWVNQYLMGISVSATMPAISFKAFGALKIHHTPLPTQRKIASILSAYDDLIENNLKRIKLLEEKAQLHYKELMQEMSYSKTKREEYIKECLEFYIGGGWGDEEYKEGFTEPAFVIRGTDIPDAKKGDVNGVPFRYHKPSNLASRSMNAGDIIFEVSGGSKGQPVGRSVLITEKMLQQFAKPVMCASFCKMLRANENVTPEFFYLFLLASHENGLIAQYEKHSASNIVNYGFEEFIGEQKITIPNETELRAFTDSVKPIYALISILGEQNSKLREARDILLPRLMSGQIEV
jgi:type I restriction enzyme S subunit